MKYLEWMSPEWVQVLFVLFLSFLIGLEREERKDSEGHYSFGGVRTFPLIGLIGYSMGLISGGELLPQALGFAVVAGFLMISYWHKLTSSTYSGVTSEMSGLTTYLVGALVYHQMFWIATTLTVSSIILLELKAGLENLAKRIETTDILTFAKFLLLSSVILPLLPDAQFSQFQINPFKTWLVVVAVSAISYGSYVLQRLNRGQGGIILAAFLGGAYSSTVTTVALARRSKSENQPHLFSGGLLIASGMMYLRLAVLLALFNQELMARLSLPFLGLGIFAVGVGWLWSTRRDESELKLISESKPKNPLEISAALLFALLFVVMLIATHFAIVYLGEGGVYTLAAVMGVTDVDPFIMGLTQATPTLTPLHVASSGILIAASSNNVVKGLYAFVLSSRQTGTMSLVFLLALAAFGLVPLFF
ncbi:MgtC family protein [mine drainage metagenome]|uniref:MgtC family protein n=1 Tax=mine drainage metagenome TaxID=410659 RepID=A0A1J5TE13_9ZZZZ